MANPGTANKTVDAEISEMSELIHPAARGHDDAWPARWRTSAHSISSGRYIDPDFAALEFERLWSRVWQAAARLDEIPEAGDYTVYEIGDQSVLLVRVDAATVKAYHNFCPHRGTALGEGCGKFEHERIICPFHGWRWDLRGQNQYVLERQEFRNGELRDSDVALKEVSVALFAGFVFINLARNPEPFDDFIAPVRQLIEDLAIGDMHHYWWKEIAAPGNWKVAQEAFFESYHVPTTHPQLETAGADFIFGDMSGPEVDFSHHYHQYETFAHGHGRFFGGKKTPMAGHVTLPGDPVEMMAARLNLLVEGMDAMVLAEDVELVRSLKGKPIPEGSSLGGEYMKLLYSRPRRRIARCPGPRRSAGHVGRRDFRFPEPDDPAASGQRDDLPRAPAWLGSRSLHLRDPVHEDLSRRGHAAARDGGKGHGSVGSRAAAADPAPGPGQHPAHAKRTALARLQADLAGQLLRADHPAHAPGARPLPAGERVTGVRGCRYRCRPALPVARR